MLYLRPKYGIYYGIYLSKAMRYIRQTLRVILWDILVINCWIYLAKLWDILVHRIY